ncbi:hypothetical protein BGZ73_000578 [Actinomortierella ambigua]|nr:hypothetical protein BGZ73_000578 [Actinomortierella ambigua]
MLVQSGQLNPVDDGYMLSAVVVTGPAAGTVKDIRSGITVAENIHGTSSSGSGGGRKSPPTVGLIIAIVVIVIFVLAVIYGIVRYRKKRTRKAKPPAGSTAEPSPYTQEPIHPQPIPQYDVSLPMHAHILKPP